MDQTIDLKTIRNLHSKWLRNESDGKRADLRDANLSGEYLSGANHFYLTRLEAEHN